MQPKEKEQEKKESIKMKTIKQLEKELKEERIHEMRFHLVGQLKQSEDILKLINSMVAKSVGMKISSTILKQKITGEQGK